MIGWNCSRLNTASGLEPEKWYEIPKLPMVNEHEGCPWRIPDSSNDRVVGETAPLQLYETDSL